jgi:hypothetical protein
MKTKLLFVSCLFSLQAFAQISGKVTDGKQQFLPGATVQLFKSNKPVTAKLTDAEGRFSFAGTADYLVISYTGYLTDTLKEPKPGMLVTLQADTKILKEIRMQAKQPVLRQETDRTVIAVNEQVRKLADNGLEIVKLAPGITVGDDEDAILMSGKAEVQVMINDKVVKMTPRDLAKFLKAMPSGGIQAVEIMINPPAKYEVNGNTGIINIRTNTLPKGFNGNLDYSTSQSTYNWSDLSGILNYGSGKFAVSAYGGWHTGGYLTNDLKTRQFTDGTLRQQNSNLDKWNDPIFRITIDYQLSKRSTIGGLIEREASTNTASYTTNSRIDHRSLPDSAYITTGRIPYVQHWNNYNLNYRYSDTTGNELTADLDRAAYARDNHTEVLITGEPTIIYHTLTDIDINTFKTDYTDNWKNKLKLETGLKISSVQTNDNQDGNRFRYNEDIRAVYGSLSKDYGKWGVQLGLRVEQTSAKGIADPVSGTEVIKADTRYLNLLPSLYLTYAPDAKNNFRLSFSRRVKRPDYDDLQPITYELDPLDYKTGNPGLKEQFNDNAELSYTFDDRITLVSSFTHAADYFNPVILQIGNILYQITGNAGTMNTLNFDLNYPVKVNKWWNMLNKVNVAGDHFKGQQFQGYLDQGKWHYQLLTTQRFNLPGKYILQLGARYTSASQNLIYYQQSSANTTASISRKLFNDQASFRIAVSDIFKTQRNYTSVNFGSLNYTDLGVFESRRVSFSFSWRFGNQKIRKPEDRERGDADEKSRSGS